MRICPDIREGLVIEPERISSAVTRAAPPICTRRRRLGAAPRCRSPPYRSEGRSYPHCGAGPARRTSPPRGTASSARLPGPAGAEPAAFQDIEGKIAAADVFISAASDFDREIGGPDEKRLCRYDGPPLLRPHAHDLVVRKRPPQRFEPRGFRQSLLRQVTANSPATRAAAVPMMLTLPSAWRISPASIAAPYLRSKPSTNCRLAGGAAGGDGGGSCFCGVPVASAGGSTAGGCSAAVLGSWTAAAGASFSSFRGCAEAAGGSLTGFRAAAEPPAAQLPAFAWAGRQEPFLPLASTPPRRERQDSLAFRRGRFRRGGSRRSGRRHDVLFPARSFGGTHQFGRLPRLGLRRWLAGVRGFRRPRLSL